MQITRIALIAFSPCTTTLASLRAVGDGLGKALALPVTEHDLTLPESRAGLYAFGPSELVVFGFPVYGGRLPRTAPEIFAAVRGNATPAVLAAVYGNRDYEDALLEMQREAESRGFIPFAATAPVAEHCMERSVAAGRPDAQDKDLLARFGEAAANHIRELASPADAAFTAPGVFPYRKEINQAACAPKAPEGCTRCGSCAAVCPTGAIVAATPETADDAACIRCMACVNTCPESARKPMIETFPQITAWLRENCAKRREPEFFPEACIPG